MFTTLTKYRALALSIGLGSLVAHGGDSPASNSNPVVNSTTNGEPQTLAADTPTNDRPVPAEKIPAQNFPVPAQ